LTSSELPWAVPDTAGRGPNWDRGPCAGHAGAARRCTKRHRLLWAQPGPGAVHGPRELRRPRNPLGTSGRERFGGAARLGADLLYAGVFRHAGPARGPWAASGPEELRDSERSHGCRRDTVTVCFQYRVPQVTVSDDSTYCSELALLHSDLCVAIRILPLELWPRVLKQTARKLVSLVTPQLVCESR
jgi:hypothetical protein